MTSARGTLLSLLALTVAGAAGATAGTDSPLETIRLDFTQQVQNIESLQSQLFTQAEDGIAVCDRLEGELRFGRIPFRMPGEGAASTDNFLAFMVAYEEGKYPSALLDFNQDGSIDCDEKIPLLEHPQKPGHLFRTLVLGGSPARPKSRYRLTLPAFLGAPEGDRYSLDIVDVPVAHWNLDSGRTIWVLYDGNHDGVYDRRFGDGVLLDTSGSGYMSTDPYAGNFFSYNLPLKLPWGTYEVVEVDPEGRYMTLAQLEEGAAAKFEPLRPGDTSEAVECEDSAGQPVKLGGATGKYQLLHFWLSQCGSCERDVVALASVLKRIGPARLEAVGISLDETESTYRRFVTTHQPAWPQCYVGATFWDNPVAVRFGVVGASDLILLDPDGRILVQAHGIHDLMPRLEEIFPELSGTATLPEGS